MALQRDYGTPERNATRQNGLHMIGKFVQLDLAVLYDLDLKPIDLRVYLVICDQSWQQGECGLPQPELARLVGRSQRQLQESLDHLVARQLVGRHRWGPTQAKHYWPIPSDPQTHEENRVCLLLEGGDTRGKPRHTHAENLATHMRKTSPVTLLVKTGPEDTGHTVATQPGPPQPAPAAEPPPERPLDRPPNPVPPPPPAPTNKRLARVIDLIRAGGQPYTRSDRDGAAMRECDAEPEEIARCYLDIATGQWPSDGDTFPLRGLSIQSVCRQWINGWRLRGTSAARAPRGRASPSELLNRPYDGSRHGGFDDEMRADIQKNTRY